MVEQGILGLAERNTGGKGRPATLSTSRDTENFASKSSV
jgi:hypothetical protein